MISILIIVGSTEPQTLTHTLPELLSQQCDQEFEVIVVRETKNGETLDVLKPLMAQYPNLHSTYVPDKPQYVSVGDVAITLGVKAAHHPTVVIIEPDFLPPSDSWLTEVAQAVTTDDGTPLPVLLGKAPRSGRSFFARIGHSRHVGKALRRWARQHDLRPSSLRLSSDLATLFTAAVSKAAFLEDIYLRAIIFDHQR